MEGALPAPALKTEAAPGVASWHRVLRETPRAVLCLRARGRDTVMTRPFHRTPPPRTRPAVGRSCWGCLTRPPPSPAWPGPLQPLLSRAVSPAALDRTLPATARSGAASRPSATGPEALVPSPHTSRSDTPGRCPAPQVTGLPTGSAPSPCWAGLALCREPRGCGCPGRALHSPAARGAGRHAARPPGSHVSRGRLGRWASSALVTPPPPLPPQCLPWSGLEGPGNACPPKPLGNRVCAAVVT